MRLRMPTLTLKPMQTPLPLQMTPMKAPVQRALVLPRLRWALARPWLRRVRRAACGCDEQNRRWLELDGGGGVGATSSRSRSEHSRSLLKQSTRRMAAQSREEAREKRTKKEQEIARQLGETLNVSHASASIKYVQLTFKMFPYDWWLFFC
jgi:hypothetical protein